MTDSKEIQTIAILGGTGKAGPGLAMRWAKAGFKVIIGSRQAEKAQTTADQLNEKLGIDTVEGHENSEAARLADLNVLTVEQSAQEAALKGLKDDLQGKILVDATSRVDFRDPQPPDPPAAARLAQNILGEGVPVVAAFQNVSFLTLKRKLDEPMAADVLVCSDDLQAAGTVIGLVEAGNMPAFYGGTLDNAIIVEGLTALLISMNNYYGGHTGALRITGIEKSARE